MNKKTKNYFTKRQVSKLKNNADLFAKEAKFIQDGWVNLPETDAFVVRTDAKFFKSMLEVMNAVPEVFEQLSITEAFMLANMVLTDASSLVGMIITNRFSYTQKFNLYHDGLWISPWYQQLYSVEDLTEMSESDIV